MMKKPLIAILFVLLASPTFAADTSETGSYTYYVSTTGTAEWSRNTNACGSASGRTYPCSIAKAMAYADDDNTVIFLDGQYNVGTQSTAGGDGYRIPILYPANSGSSGHPITFKAENKGLAILNGTTTTGHANVIGAYSTYTRTWLVWDGFKFTSNSSDGLSWPSARYHDTSPRAVYVTVQHCEFVGGVASVGGGNYSATRFEGTSNVTIHGCYIHDYVESASSHNGPAMLNYTSENCIVEYNELSGNSFGYYQKTGGTDLIIRYNYFHNNIGWSMYNTTDATYEPDRITVHNNVFVNNGGGIAAGSGDNGDGNIFYNNTIYNTAGNGIDYRHSSDLKLYNNIIRAPSTAPDSGYETRGIEAYAFLAECDHNQYGPTFTIIWQRYAAGETFYTSLSSWQNSGKLNGGYNPGTYPPSGSTGTTELASDPVFVNSSGTYANLNDWCLQAASPCKGAGRSGADMGADIDTIAANLYTPVTGCSTITPPSAQGCTISGGTFK